MEKPDYSPVSNGVDSQEPQTPAGLSYEHLHHSNGLKAFMDLDASHMEAPVSNHKELLNGLMLHHQSIIFSLRDKLHSLIDNSGDEQIGHFLANLLKQHENTVQLLNRYKKAFIAGLVLPLDECCI